MKAVIAVILLLSVTQFTYSQNAKGLGESKAVAGNAPDYSNLYYWAAHPLKHDAGDSIPLFLKNEKRDSAADVFYLHPTTYTGSLADNEWNADVNNDALNTYTDNRAVLNQATIFNGSCKVYAPRYRQAHLRAFFAIGNKAAAAAFDVAYEDLRNAFQYYLDHYNHGRPIVIASHSQGSLHAIRLLKEFFDGKPLQQQLVCAYIVGWNIKRDDFVSIPLGTTPTATGCVVGWRTYKKGYADWLVKRENGNSLCVNPLTWTTTFEWAAPSLHKGMIGKNFNTLIKGNIGAGIDEEYKILGVEVSGDDAGFNLLNNYHVGDYNLFYMNVRENVKARIDAFLKR